MEREKIRIRTNSKIFHLTSFKIKHKKMENKYILSNQQINEVINMNKPTKIKAFILKNHRLLNYYLTNLPQYPADIKGISDSKYSSNYNSFAIQKEKEKKNISKYKLYKKQINITELDSIKMAFQAQLIFFNKIKNSHYRQLNDLTEESNIQKEIMNFKDFNIFNCDIKSYFLPPCSKRKKIFYIINEKCSTSSKSQYSQGVQKANLNEEETSNLLDLKTKSLNLPIENKLKDQNHFNLFEEIENAKENSELEAKNEQAAFTMFGKSDLMKFIPETFRDEYNSCL